LVCGAVDSVRLRRVAGHFELLGHDRIVGHDENERQGKRKEGNHDPKPIVMSEVEFT
jgi:hypothetical protein